MAIWAWIALGWLGTLAAFAVYVFRSPTGYEDDTGFHLGYPPGYLPPERVERLRLAYERVSDDREPSMESWANMVVLREEVAELLKHAKAA